MNNWSPLAPPKDEKHRVKSLRLMGIRDQIKVRAKARSVAELFEAGSQPAQNESGAPR